MIEMLLGLWAANLPVLAPLVRTARNYCRSSSFYRTFSASDLTERGKQKTGVYSFVCVRP